MERWHEVKFTSVGRRALPKKYTTGSDGSDSDSDSDSDSNGSEFVVDDDAKGVRDEHYDRMSEEEVALLFVEDDSQICYFCREPADEDFPLLIHDECTYLKNETCDLAFHAKCYDAETPPRKKGKRSKREKRALARDKCPCSFCFHCHESTINNKSVVHQCRCNSVVHLECISTCEDDLKFYCPICKDAFWKKNEQGIDLTGV